MNIMMESTSVEDKINTIMTLLRFTIVLQQKTQYGDCMSSRSISRWVICLVLSVSSPHLLKCQQNYKINARAKLDEKTLPLL